ncbi:MAG TPA: flagellar basal body-associated FliL family protein [Noviherbaspirillum sp.]|nr:flagellar basal body-associated FliL family protein [Noviherbaspirillum sp.]
MAKKAAREKNLKSVIAIVVAVLAVGFTAAWLYLQYREKQDREIAYLPVPTVAISRDGHSIRASFAIRTSAADAAWAAKNKAALEQVMSHALLEVDPVAARAPGGLQALQDKVRETSNALFQSERIQEVLVTDFLVSEGDY